MNLLAHTIGRSFSPAQKQQLRQVQRIYARLTCGTSLSKLATFYHSDKNDGHFYTQHYESHFRSFRRSRIKVLEIGIGGNEDPQGGGASLRMWKAYFPYAEIFGVDLYRKDWHDESRIKTFCGSQGNDEFLRSVVAQTGQLDIIIDDGSHRSEHVIGSFKTLFPLLADGGYYVAEDLQTSYWAEYGGNEKDIDDVMTSMGFFKSLIHGLNYAEFRDPNREPMDFDRDITAISFYHNMVFIKKGNNVEPSYVY